MDERPINVLLIEADPDHAQQLQGALVGAAEPSIRVTHAETPANGLACLNSADVDAVLVSLILPDADGLAAIGAIHARFSTLPIVALAARHYLANEQIDRAMLGPALRTALNRRRLVAELERERHEREIVTVEQAGQPRALGITARVSGSGPLKETAPAAFSRLEDAARQ